MGCSEETSSGTRRRQKITFMLLGRSRLINNPWLNRAYVARDVHLIFLPVDPKWDPYRADPRFTALLARCDFARTAAKSSAVPTPTPPPASGR
jgi:hypothetical protein